MEVTHLPLKQIQSPCMTSSYLFYLIYLERKLIPDQYKMTALRATTPKPQKCSLPIYQLKKERREFTEVHSNLSALDLGWKET